MEPFDLSLHKVNLEEKDIGEGDALNAFSDIYCYESDFQSDSASLPVRGKKLGRKGDIYGKRSPQDAKESLIDLIHASNTEYYTQGSGRAGSHDYRLPEGLRCSTDEQHNSVHNSTRTDQSSESPRHGVSTQYRDLNGQASSPQHGTLNEQMPSPLKGEISGNSFRAFTDTVDALALQTSVIDAEGLQASVIGNSTVIPASAEQVAQAIAETQRKLLNQSQDHTQEANEGPSAEFAGAATANAESDVVIGASPQQAHHDSPRDLDTQSIDSSVSSEQLPSFGSQDNQNNTSVASPPETGTNKKKSKHKKKSSVGSDGASPRGAKPGQELIRIPKDEITTSVEKGSWFIRRAACSNPHVSVETKEKGEKHVVGENSGSEEDETGVENTRGDEPNQEQSSNVQDENTLNDSLVTKETIVATGDQSAELVTLVKEETVIATERQVSDSSREIAVHTPLSLATALGDAVVVEKTEVENELESPSSETIQMPVETQREKVEPKSAKVETAPAAKVQKEKVFENIEEQSFTGAPVLAMADGYDSLRRQTDLLMKARAKLEGQLEVMEAESKMALQQRADLQAQVAALQQQLKSQEVNVTMATNERDALSSDMKTMKETRGRLEQVIVDAQKIIEDKDQDLETVREDLKLVQQANEKLQDKLKEVKREAQAKSSTAEDLKNKIAELYVQFETTNQTKILLENEIKSVRSELKTLSTAKEWYQDQLKQAQSAKNDLQREVTTVKGELIAKSTVIERLKADSVRLKQQLTDTQQRIIQEKQLLAQHLEAIEADMVEREAAFSQIQRERDALQEMLKSRGHNPDLALQQFSGEGSSETNDLANDLDLRRMQNDVKRKQAHIAVLEHEQAELMKRLALSQESILERDKTMETIEQKYIGVEVELRKIQQEMGFSNEEMSKLRQEKGLLEVELRSVKEEKSSFDTVIQNLKGDMTKVESSFHRIKQELAKKTDELNRVKVEKDQANEALAARDVAKSNGAIQLANETANANLQTSHSERENLRTVNASHSPKEITADHEFDKDLRAMKSQNSALLQQIEKLTTDTNVAVQKLESEKLELEQKLNQVKNSEMDMSVVFQNTVKQVEKSVKAISGKIHGEEYKISKEDLVRLYSVRDSESVDVIDENCRLKLALLKLQQERDEGSEETSGQHKLQERIDELQATREDLESKIADRSLTWEAEKSSLVNRVTELEKELEQSKRSMGSSEEDRIMSLSLELEKERGKLAGVTQNYEQLKAHTGVLESLIAAKESSSVQQSSQAEQDLQTRDKDIDELQTTIQMLETAITKEKNTVKEFKKQLMTEKGGHVKTRRKFEALFVEHDQMRIDYENKIRQVEEVDNALQRSKDIETSCRADCDRMVTELQRYKVEVERLQREVGEREAKDPVLSDQIKTLEWKLQEKEQELKATIQQLRLIEERQIEEVDNMRKTIQTNTNELSRLREEMTLSKREKASLQARVVDLKTALQSTVNANKAGSPLKIDLTAIEKLLKETNSPSKQSKPLSFLQATLSDLRGEISTLQTQMEEHASTLQSSSIAWKELEQQVKDLREVCKSTAAEREASQSLLTGAAHAAASSPIAMATQAAARSQSNIAFIPPLPVQLPANIDFSLPTDEAHASSNGEASADTTALETVIDTGSGKSSKTGSPERRLNTKAMPLNSIYAPATN